MRAAVWVLAVWGRKQALIRSMARHPPQLCTSIHCCADKAIEGCLLFEQLSLPAKQASGCPLAAAAAALLAAAAAAAYVLVWAVDAFDPCGFLPTSVCTADRLCSMASVLDWCP